MKDYEKRPLLKKYADEILENSSEDFLQNIAHDFADNTRDYKALSKAIANQLITTIKGTFKIKAKSKLSVFYVETSKDFTNRILSHLPLFMRKDPLIIEIAKSVSKELQRVDLNKKESINSLSNSTNINLLERSEKIYGIKTNYALGIKFRQNRLIAREVTNYETFNNPYILKISKLFNVGEVIDIINNKSSKILTIVLKENIGNIKGIDEYKEHLREFSPAFYTIIITN
ncbi:hypothetical protein [Cetobacterium sp.]|uniref:hypothetical protein n=1 Tax=Cetobacterium sp. TaxID=2071632 RepID=UPI003EE5BA1C